MERAPVTYELHGVRVQTSLPLSAAITSGAPDMVVALVGEGEVPARPESGVLLAEIHDGPLSVWVVRREDRYVCGFGGVCRFAWGGERPTLEVLKDPRADRRMAPLLLESSVLAVILALEGVGMLHASAVERDGWALVFAGPSGAGKSTVAACLCASAGAALLSDDALRVELDSAGPVCSRGTTSVRLRDGAHAVHAQLSDGGGARTCDGRLTARPPTASASRLPVRAIIFPRPSRSASRVSVERLSARDGLIALLSASRTAGWTVDGPVRGHFQLAAWLIQWIPVLAATIPWGPCLAPGVVGDLLTGVERAVVGARTPAGT